MLELIKSDIKASPTTLSEEQYNLIETLFTMGKSRSEVIKAMNFDENYYYRRLSNDLKLANAESKGKNMWLLRFQSEIPAAIAKMTLGEMKVQRKVFKRVDIDENGNQIEVVTNIIEEDKWFQGNSALVSLLAKQVVPNMMNDSTSEDDYDKYISELSEEERLKLEEISAEIFKKI
jgi:hypothetical protein